MKLVSSFVFVVVFSALVAGCGKSGSDNGSTSPSNPKSEDQVKIPQAPAPTEPPAPSNQIAQPSSATPNLISPNDIDRPAQSMPIIERKKAIGADGKCTAVVVRDWDKIYKKMGDHLLWKLKDMMANPMVRTPQFKAESASKIGDILLDIETHKKQFGDYVCATVRKNGEQQLESVYFDKQATDYQVELSKLM